MTALPGHSLLQTQSPPHPNHEVLSCLRLVQAHEPSQLQNELQKTPKNVRQLPAGITFAKYCTCTHTRSNCTQALPGATHLILEGKTWEWWA